MTSNPLDLNRRYRTTDILRDLAAYHTYCSITGHTCTPVPDSEPENRRPGTPDPHDFDFVRLTVDEQETGWDVVRAVHDTVHRQLVLDVRDPDIVPTMYPNLRYESIFNLLPETNRRSVVALQHSLFFVHASRLCKRVFGSGAVSRSYDRSTLKSFRIGEQDDDVFRQVFSNPSGRSVVSRPDADVQAILLPLITRVLDADNRSDALATIFSVNDTPFRVQELAMLEYTLLGPILSIELYLSILDSPMVAKHMARGISAARPNVSADLERLHRWLCSLSGEPYVVRPRRWPRDDTDAHTDTLS